MTIKGKYDISNILDLSKIPHENKVLSRRVSTEPRTLLPSPTPNPTLSTYVTNQPTNSKQPAPLLYPKEVFTMTDKTIML